jgi:hypothetical protein
MLSSLAILNMNGVEINVDILLFGNYFPSDETNCELFLIIQRYIKDTGRFSVLLYQIVSKIIQRFYFQL